MAEAPSKGKRSTETPPTSSSKGSEDISGRHCDVVSEGTFLPSPFERTENQPTNTEPGVLSLQEMIDASVDAKVHASMLSFEEMIDASVDAKVRALMTKVENVADKDKKECSKAHDTSLAAAAEAPSDIGSQAHSGEMYENVPNRTGEDDIIQDKNDAAGAFCPPSQGTILWFNRVCYIASFVAFIYLTSVVVGDYIQQWSYDAPLTGLSVQSDPLQLFPGIIVCNLDFDVEITILRSFIASKYTSDGSTLTDYWKPLDCGNDCWQLDAPPLPAFKTDPLTGTCTEKNTIVVTLNINSDRRPSIGAASGIHGILYEREESERMADFWCSNRTGSCGTGAESSEQACSADSGDLSYNDFYASSGMANYVMLKHSETGEGGPQCDQDHMLQSWSPTNVGFTLKKSFVESRNVSSADTLVVLSFEFQDAFVEKRKYQPDSGAAMFGAVAGWFGCLSDGWGMITLLFMVERHFLPSMMIGGKAMVYAKQTASDTVRSI